MPPLAVEAARPSESGEAGGALGRGIGGRGLVAHLGSVGGVGRRGRSSDEGAWRWLAVAVAAGCYSGEGDAMPDNERQCKPLWVLGRSLGRLESTG
jgi:hypothetical protein